MVSLLKVLAAALGVPLVFVGAGWFAWRVTRRRTIWQGIRLGAILVLILVTLVLLGVPQRVFGQVTAVPVTITVQALDADQPLQAVVVRLADIPTGSVPTDDQGRAVLAAPPGRLILTVTGVTAAGEPLHFPAVYDALGGLPIFVQETPTTITLIADRDGTLHPVALDPNAVNQATGSQDAPTDTAVPAPATTRPATGVPSTAIPTDVPTATIVPSTMIPPATITPALPTVALPTAAPFAPPAGVATPPAPPTPGWSIRQALICGIGILCSCALLLWASGSRRPAPRGQR